MNDGAQNIIGYQVSSQLIVQSSSLLLSVILIAKCLLCPLYSQDSFRCLHP